MTHILNCEHCHRPFKAHRRDAKTCSDACRVAAHKKRQQDRNYTPQALNESQREWLAWLGSVNPDAYTRVWNILITRGAFVAGEALDAIAVLCSEQNKVYTANQLLLTL